MYGVHFSVDQLGDVYLVGRVSLDCGDRGRAGPAARLRADLLRRELRHAARAGLRRVDPAGVEVAGQPGRVAGQPAGVRPLREDPSAHWVGRHEPRTPGTLVLLRHGESEWNAKNLFTGWVDVDLSEHGRRRGRPRRAAARRRRACCPTSCTPRCCAGRSARRTSRSTRCDRHWVPVRRSWRLNERHYGALQGKDKKQTLEAVRRGAVHALAPLVRRPAAADRRRRRVQPDRRPALRRPAARAAPADRVPRRTSSTGCCRTGTTRSCPTCVPARRCW